MDGVFCCESSAVIYVGCGKCFFSSLFPLPDNQVRNNKYTESYTKASNAQPLCFTSQGKEIIEFYLNELEDEGITRVPRWTPSSVSLPLPRPTSLSTSPPVLPKLAMAPAVSVPQPSDAKDSASQDTKQDSGALQADSLTEILAGTPEGLSTSTETSQQNTAGVV